MDRRDFLELTAMVTVFAGLATPRGEPIAEAPSLTEDTFYRFQYRVDDGRWTDVRTLSAEAITEPLPFTLPADIPLGSTVHLRFRA
jgi:hypothetical protein